MSVKRKVSWPHEPILSGVSRQRVTHDQLSLTQWVQGFCKNILEQKSSERQKIMIPTWVILWKTPQIFLGKGLRQHILCCYVRWSAVPSSGKTWIVSTGPMLKSTCHIGQGVSKPWITQVGNHGTAKITKSVHVVTYVTMSSMGRSTNIFVHFVWLGEANETSRKIMSS